MGIPERNISVLRLNGTIVWRKGKAIKKGIIYSDNDKRYVKILKGEGDWNIEAY